MYETVGSQPTFVDILVVVVVFVLTAAAEVLVRSLVVVVWIGMLGCFVLVAVVVVLAAVVEWR